MLNVAARARSFGASDGAALGSFAIVGRTTSTPMMNARRVATMPSPYVMPGRERMYDASHPAEACP